MLETHSKLELRPEAKKLLFYQKRSEDSSTRRGHHECRILGPFPTGQVQNLTQQPIYKFKVARFEDFVGRQLDMHQVFVCVM
jgi:hypothetical protein